MRLEFLKFVPYALLLFFFYVFRLDADVLNIHEKMSSMSMSMPLRSDVPSVTSIKTSDSPSIIPSDSPSMMPSDSPSMIPTDSPSMIPSDLPSMIPSDTPSLIPSDLPSMIPSDLPSMIPSDAPNMMPRDVPSLIPSHFPLLFPSTIPSAQVADAPIATSTKSPTLTKSANPSSSIPSCSNSSSTSVLCGDDDIVVEQHNATSIPINVLPSPTSSPTTSNNLQQVGLNDNSSAKRTSSGTTLKPYGLSFLVGAVFITMAVVVLI